MGAHLRMEGKRDLPAPSGGCISGFAVEWNAERAAYARVRNQKLQGRS